jgi:hypothetical protein
MVNQDRDNGQTPDDSTNRPLWAYGYALAPPVARDRLAVMQTILDAGRAEARTRSEVWEGRFINGDYITHILVVSGSPDQKREINRRLEAELNRLAAVFSVSRSVEVERDPGRPFGGGRFPPGTAS